MNEKGTMNDEGKVETRYLTGLYPPDLFTVHKAE